MHSLIKLLFSGRCVEPSDCERRTKWADADSVEVKVREIVARITLVPIENIRADSFIYRISSSNDEIEVIMQCEEDFEIEIPDGEVEQCESVGALVAYIKRRLDLHDR